MQKVFVLNGDGSPLMPCHPARARELLRRGKAQVVRVVPFTIRLTYAIENPGLQEVVVGVDDGVRNAGVAVVSNGEVLLKGTIRIRDNVKRLMDLRRQRRRQRRRGLRHRQPRYLNKGWGEGWLSPSLEVGKDNIWRVVEELSRLLPISLVRLEWGMFDVSQLASEEELVGEDYQDGLFRGWENRKQAVLFRDHYTCVYCGRDVIQHHLIAEVDHIVPRSKGGTDTFRNLVCACRECNQDKRDRTAEEYGHPDVEGGDFRVPALLNSGKVYLFSKLSGIAPVERCFGYQTKVWRRQMGLSKGHFEDAKAIAVRGSGVRDRIEERVFVARRRNRDIFNRKVVEFGGLRHWDVVKVAFKRGVRKGQSFLGTVRAFVPGRNMVKLRLPFEDNYGVSLNQVSLVQRSRGVVFC